MPSRKPYGGGRNFYETSSPWECRGSGAAVATPPGLQRTLGERGTVTGLKADQYGNPPAYPGLDLINDGKSKLPVKDFAHSIRQNTGKPK
jgi:hypothetical protein